MQRINKLLQFFIIAFCVLIFCSFSNTKIANAAYTLENTAFYAYKDRSIGTNYQLEGVAFYAFTTQQENSVPIYRFYNKTNGDHFYTADEAEKNKIITSVAAYTYEEIVFYANTSKSNDTMPVYRFLNTINGDHFYTADEAEKIKVQKLNSIYAYEGVAFYTFTTNVPNSSIIYRYYNNQNGDHFYTASESEAAKLNDLFKKNSNPVYRFYNTLNGDHFYTADEAEKNKIINTQNSPYKYEGAGFYAYTKQIDGTYPIYRFFNKISGDHFYTADEDEKTKVQNLNSIYIFEGIAFYTFVTQTANMLPVYRLYNGIDHFYTLDEIEKNFLITSLLGPNISVGLWYYEKTDIQNDPFEIEANKPYNIKDKNGNLIAQIDGSTPTKVTYDADGNFKAYSSLSDKLLNTSVIFDAADGDNTSIIFNVHRPNSSYDKYRGKITVRYYKGNNIIASTSDTVTQIWVINTLPLEHYTWGMGETTGTGDIEHTKVMTTIFRTYGRWYIEYATKYAPLGFKIRSDSGSQIYKGYEWEQTYPNITKAANATRGSIATYGSEIALTPYSSWSDGRTRSYKERWGSSDYPWCKAVDDPYGKHPSKSTTTLENEGNHMVGLIANGSLVLARDHDWNYDNIMKYYYSGISLNPLY